MEKQLVVFELSEEHYGVDIAAIESIIKLQAITQMPHTPDFVEGITTLRGSIVPVINLRTRFNLPKVPPTKETRIIVASMDETSKVGMIVDSVSQVLRVNEEAIEPPPPVATTINSVFITGIAKLEECLVIVLDLNTVLNAKEKQQLIEAEIIEPAVNA